MLLSLIGVLIRREAERTAREMKAAPSGVKVSEGVAARSVASGETSAERAAVTAREQAFARLTYAQAWESELPAAMSEFRAWVSEYRVADAGKRGVLIARGVELARARRPEMLRMIQTEPQRALAVTVPASLRQILPADVVAELETRVAGRGDHGWLVSSDPEFGYDTVRAAMRRVAVLGGVKYSAYVYGRREGQGTKEGASLHGVALEGHLALHESPLRVLEPGELPRSGTPDSCPVSDEPVEIRPDLTVPDAVALDAVEVEGRTMEFCGGQGMLDLLEQRLLVGEEATGPSVKAVVSDGGDAVAGVPRAAAPATAHTLGVKQVLVLRVDTSDYPGEPVSVAAAQAEMDNNVRTFIDTYSYGQASVTGTVSTKVYRMPRTGASYAVGDDEWDLHADAVAAASADYTMANYYFVVVVHPLLHPSRVPGSLITYGGEAMRGGTRVVINGGASIGSITHEIGHCYGLAHSNLWQVSDGNPISAAGTTVEYGDAFDMMGSAALAFSGTRDTRHHFNPWQKNLLGWLPDAAVTTVASSGTYRIHRFDSRGTALNQPLALRVFRDGVRWYWVGFRQSFTTNAALTNGAYVVWGYNNSQQSQLLDLTTPGVGTNDAALPIGTTFSDPTYGIAIRPIARGGAEPTQWLDVEITVPETPPSVVAAWGRNGSAFFSPNTGAVVNPTPETYVPFGLTGVRAIAAGDAHGLALKTDGSLVAWGDNSSGQTTLPAGLSGNVVAIAAGANVSGAVRRDGTVQLWGASTSGVTTPPANLSGVRQLAIGGGTTAGAFHALALRTDGTVVAWGSNSAGQTSVPPGLVNVVAVAASDRLSVALRADGTVVRWGVTFAGAVPFPAGLSGVTAIASSGSAQFALALKIDGTVVGWGANASGQATVPAGLAEVVSIATGGSHSLALKADGTVVAWGSNSSRQTEVPASLPRGFQIAASRAGSFLVAGPRAYLIAQPQAQTVAAGGTAVLSVTVTGTSAATYQWRRDGVVVPGATTNMLQRGNVAAGDAGTYEVVVGDGTGTIVSAPARLTVVAAGAPTNPGRLVNLSILTTVSAGEPLFTLGTVLGGAGTRGDKPVLVRAAGPSLAPLGVAAPLGDPRLAVLSGQRVVAQNDNWGSGGPPVNAVFSRVGAFPFLAPSSLDAAVYNPAQAAGDYTVQVSGAAGATGTVIAELYDATPTGEFSTTTPRLVNVSVLKRIEAAEVLTAGFVIGGAAARQVLVRAVGPTLGAAPFNVPGVMADPRIDLFRGQEVIQANDNWGGGLALATAAGNVGAFALGTLSRDAVLLAKLEPGNYTVQVRGVGASAGLTLVEVYEVP